MMKNLCVYHTRSGISEEIARQIARELDAETLEVTDGRSYRGFFGYIAAAVTGLRKKLPALSPDLPDCPLETYDRVIVVSPIWCENVSPVMRAFLARNKGRFRGDICYVIGSMSGLSYLPKIDALCELTGKPYTDLLEIRTQKNDWHAELAEWIGKLKA